MKIKDKLINILKLVILYHKLQISKIKKNLQLWINFYKRKIWKKV